MDTAPRYVEVPVDTPNVTHAGIARLCSKTFLQEPLPEWVLSSIDWSRAYNHMVENALIFTKEGKAYVRIPVVKDK